MTGDTEIKNEVAVIEKESSQVLTEAKLFKISDQPGYEKAATFIRGVKALQKKVEQTFTPIVQKAHATWKEAKGQEKIHLEPLQEAERIVKKVSLVWYEEQERIRLDDERKAREKADAAEKKRKADLEAQAKNWDEKGNTEKAEERRAALDEVFIPATPVIPTAQKSAGQSIKENWKAEVSDLKALIKAVAEGRAPLNFIQADMTVINKQAKATKDGMNFDGIKFLCEKVMAVR